MVTATRHSRRSTTMALRQPDDAYDDPFSFAGGRSAGICCPELPRKGGMWRLKLSSPPVRRSSIRLGPFAALRGAARGKTLAQSLPAADSITPATQWKVAGQPIPKVTTRLVTGRHQYAPDLRPAGCSTAKSCARLRSRNLLSCDDGAAKAIPGAVTSATVISLVSRPKRA